MFEFEGKKYKVVEGMCGDCAFCIVGGCSTVCKIWNCQSYANRGKIAVEVKDENN